MTEERSQVVHDFTLRQAGKKAYSLARLKAQTELAKLHREEFLELVHKHRDELTPESIRYAEERFQSFSLTDTDRLYDRIQHMKERDSQRRKARKSKANK